jgi:peptide/nickel transport system ATP-binding protein
MVQPRPAPVASPAVEIRDLHVQTTSGDSIIEGVSLAIAPGEVLGLVGESGSGKTTAALSMLGYTNPGACIRAGEIAIGGEVVQASSERASRHIRGQLISYVPQHPESSLNPSMRIGDAIVEMLRSQPGKEKRRSLVGPALAKLGLPESKEFRRRYPHQLSGGQQQRVCISVALVREPPVVVLDEPTTGLDVVTQATILNELRRLRAEHRISMLYVSHDLAVVANVADRIAVMYAGRIIEEGPARQILRHPRHPYTRGLLTSIPDHVRPRALQPMAGVAVGVGERPAGCCFAPRCPLRIPACESTMPPLAEVGSHHLVRCLRADQVTDPDPPPLALVSSHDDATQPVLTVSHLRAVHRGRGETVVAADDISFELGRGRCVALVGESGSGKTTIARSIAGLHPLASGEIRLGDELLAPETRKRTVEQRRRVQLIFQNPRDALNPKQRIRTIIGRPAQALRGLGAAAARAEVDRLLETVRLSKRLAERYPAELSGGERQRVGIARALAAQPELIICDEITAALDVSVQAAVLSLLGDLREELGLALLFITHDLGVVATVADHVLVLENGLICESGPTETILSSPEREYTKRLLAAAPSISVALDAWDTIEARGADAASERHL